jgi:uncharacterized surface protein with fasciclin (FAS1) repeats
MIASVATGCDSFTDKDLGDSNPQTPSITEIVTEVPALSRLEEGLRKSNLVEDLQGNGPFTVIAPDNGAFEPIGEGELSQGAVLKRVLRAHVIAQEIESFDGEDEQTYQTLAGSQVTLVSDAQGAISGANNASVTNANVTASNGVVHVIDDVLADAVDRILLTAQYRILGDLVQQEGLVGALRSDGLTVFAPSNDAFLALDDNDNGALGSSELQDINVSETLQGHVHDGVFSASDFLDPGSESPDSYFPADTTLTTLGPAPDLSIRGFEDGTVIVNPDAEEATVTVPDADTDNGVIHGIDTVLLP